MTEKQKRDKTKPHAWTERKPREAKTIVKPAPKGKGAKGGEE